MRDSLIDLLEHVLPPLGSQRDLSEPWVHSCLSVPDAAWAYYLTEGGYDRGEYLVHGFLLKSVEDKDWRWATHSLVQLRREYGSALQVDATFVPGQLTDVVALPE